MLPLYVADNLDEKDVHRHMLGADEEDFDIVDEPQDEFGVEEDASEPEAEEVAAVVSTDAK